MHTTMLLTVRHETSYDYDGFVAQIVQVLRLTPRGHDAQEVLEWRVRRTDGAALESFVDGLGNVSHVSSDRGPAERLGVVVEGRVRTTDAEGVVSGAYEPLPPSYFKRVTPLTAPSKAITALARKTVKGKAAPDRFALYDLMTAVHEHVAYTTGETHVGTPAADAFEAGQGVCQDQAHIFIAAARALGAPARYVGGYVWPGEDDAAADRPFASHAWAEAWAEGTGWVGFDPSNGVWAAESHLRVAVGLDYRQAAPIAGAWRGSGRETMHVGGRIEAAEAGQ